MPRDGRITIIAAHAAHVLAHTLLHLVSQASLQRRVLLFILRFEHILDSLDPFTVLVNFVGI